MRESSFVWSDEQECGVLDQTDKSAGWRNTFHYIFKLFAVLISLPSLKKPILLQMRLTWISGDSKPQYVRYAEGKLASSTVSTFTPSDLCDSFVSPALNFGWHNPGFIHTALLKGLLPSESYLYKYGSNEVGWSTTTKFSTPPAAGSDELIFITYGDMGKAERDGFGEHYIQVDQLASIMYPISGFVLVHIKI
eukprot:Gb_34203 [translate_table: standard]